MAEKKLDIPRALRSIETHLQKIIEISENSDVRNIAEVQKSLLQAVIKHTVKNVYVISCYSSCGSYFAIHLQSVTLTASSEEHALEVLQEFFNRTGMEFIYPREKTVKFRGKEKTEIAWDIRLLKKAEEIQNGIVIDYTEDSDY